MGVPLFEKGGYLKMEGGWLGAIGVLAEHPNMKGTWERGCPDRVVYGLALSDVPNTLQGLCHSKRRECLWECSKPSSSMPTKREFLDACETPVSRYNLISSSQKTRRARSRGRREGKSLRGSVDAPSTK